MMLVKFMCWATVESDEDDAKEIFSDTPRMAAYGYGVKRYYRYDDYPAEQDVSVRAPDGTLTRWIVVAEPTVQFSTRPADGGS